MVVFGLMELLNQRYTLVSEGLQNFAHRLSQVREQAMKSSRDVVKQLAFTGDEPERLTHIVEDRRDGDLHPIWRSVLVIVQDRLAARAVLMHRVSHPLGRRPIRLWPLQDWPKIFSAQLFGGGSRTWR